MTKTKSKRGFTLIELLVVIAIIATLSVLFINNSTSSLKKGRDAKRKADLFQYRNALEIYASKNNQFFPSRTTGSDAAPTTLCGDLAITGCAKDDLNAANSSYNYLYLSDGAGGGTASATKYVLWAKLEVTPDNWIVCSNGLSGSKPQSGFSVTGGTCPLP